MTDATYFLPYDVTPAAIRLRRRRQPRVAVGGLAVTSLLAAVVTTVTVGPAVGPGNGTMPLVAARAIAVTAEVSERAARALASIPNPMLAAAFTGRAETFADNHPVSSHFAWTSPPAPLLASIEAPAPTVAGAALRDAVTEAAVAGPVAAPADVADAIPLPPVAPSASPLITAAIVPMPVPRPADLSPLQAAPAVPRDAAPTLDRTPFRATPRPVATAAATPVPVAADNRGFLEKFFGLGSAGNPALGYAAPEDGFFNRLRGATGNPARSYGDATAVYEIATHTVFLPDGTRLEAHSGLGARLDDPHYVGDRMRGPTPPHTYSLTLREKLFHGVQALRLTPVGDGGIFGRTGLLAHTYMLGPNGDSNGCVSFRNYKAFLQAFQNGDIRRLVVVARLS